MEVFLENSVSVSDKTNEHIYCFSHL